MLKEKIVSAMIRLGIKQKDLAEKVGMSSAQLSKFINGKKYPRTTQGRLAENSYRSIAVALGLDADELVALVQKEQNEVAITPKHGLYATSLAHIANVESPATVKLLAVQLHGVVTHLHGSTLFLSTIKTPSDFPPELQRWATGGERQLLSASAELLGDTYLVHPCGSTNSKVYQEVAAFCYNLAINYDDPDKAD